MDKQTHGHSINHAMYMRDNKCFQSIQRTAYIQRQEFTSVGLTYIHTCRSYVHTPRHFTKGASLAWRLRRRISMVMFTYGWARPARSSICPILGFWGAKFTKMGDSLPWTPMNRCVKYDAASFILGGEIRNRTNTHTHTKQTNKHTHTHTHTQTVTDISTPCLSACVDNNK